MRFSALSVSLFVAFLFAFPGCGSDTDCKKGETCACDGAGDCEYNCVEAGCTFTSDISGNATFTCDDGDCTVNSTGSGDVTLDCAGGGCSVTCGGEGNCTTTSCTDCSCNETVITAECITG